LLCTNTIDPNNTLPCEDETGIPVQKSAVFGKLEQIFENNTTLLASEGINKDCNGPNSKCDNANRRMFLTKTQNLKDDPPSDDDNSCKSFVYRAKTLNIAV